MHVCVKAEPFKIQPLLQSSPSSPVAMPRIAAVVGRQGFVDHSRDLKDKVHFRGKQPVERGQALGKMEKLVKFIEVNPTGVPGLKV